jgi:osmotically inducible protein OsmC
MPIRTAETEWKGGLWQGSGHVRSESGKLDADVAARFRFGGENGTNPEELIAAAHSTCFSMALSRRIEEMKYSPKEIHTRAKVYLDSGPGGFSISRIELRTSGVVPEMSEEEFRDAAQWAKENCPVSRVLRPEKGVELVAELGEARASA